jgi:uncharacterized protein
MEINGEAKLLRIYIGSSNKFKHKPLFEMIVFAAKRYGLSGATVLKGTMGFGSESKIHSLKFWELTENTPIIVEIIDEVNKIEDFIEKIKPWLNNSKNGFLITTERVEIIIQNKNRL